MTRGDQQLCSPWDTSHWESWWHQEGDRVTTERWGRRGHGLGVLLESQDPKVLLCPLSWVPKVLTGS